MKLWKWWTVFLLLFLFPAAYFFNPDVVIIPALKIKGLQSLTILVIAGTFGAVEMLLWYLAWGGLGNLVAGWFTEDVNFAKKIAGEMKRDGYFDGIKIYFTKKYKKLGERADKLKKGLRASGYLAFLGLGCWPIPGPRMVGDFICGTARWKGCLIALCIGNFIKTAGYVFAWNKVFSFFDR